MQYGIFIRVEQRSWVVEDEENSSQRIYHVERSLQHQSSKKDWDFPSGMLSIHFSWREDMKHETRMARLGVRSTSSTHHIHLDDYTHRRIMSTLEKAFWQYRAYLQHIVGGILIRILYSSVLSRYSAHMMRQSSSKVHQAKYVQN